VRQCWEYMNCGREPGGVNAAEQGVCPAATAETYDRVNRGKNAGRYCWRVAGTLCDGEVQGTFSVKYRDCLKCEFFELVRQEEGLNHVL